MPQQQPQQHLSEEQVKRLIIAIEHLEKTNMMARVAWTAIQKAADFDGKKKIIAMTFAQAYELMLIMNMGIESKVSAEEFRKNLKAIEDGTHTR